MSATITDLVDDNVTAWSTVVLAFTYKRQCLCDKPMGARVGDESVNSYKSLQFDAPIDILDGDERRRRGTEAIISVTIEIAASAAALFLFCHSSLIIP